VKGVEPIWAKHAREQFADLGALFAAGEAAEKVVFDQGHQAILKLVAAEITEIEAKLGGPSPLDHVEYAHLHGQLRGLKSIQLARTALVSRYVAAREEQERKHEGAHERAGKVGTG
jgi:hypothetical protein